MSSDIQSSKFYDTFQALLSYTTILAVPQEIKYMWSHRYFGITTVLYAFTRYGSLILQVLIFWEDLLPSVSRTVFQAEKLPYSNSELFFLVVRKFLQYPVQCTKRRTESDVCCCSRLIGLPSILAMSRE